ncbi:ATP-binding protein [bacterium 210820-DFI.6.37]|nr:ATP-binding protein [bacterium 210820-DFI.6.37]
MKELALHIMDVMQNSITADSSEISVGVKTCQEDCQLVITVKDNGCGMDEETLKKATDPFHTSRTTRMVGLGLPMFKEAALLAGGDLVLESQVGQGTVLTASFETGSIDRQPLGNLGNVFFLTMLSHESLKLNLMISSSRGTFYFDSRRFSEALKRQGGSAMDAAFRAETLINEQVNLIFKEILPEMGGGPGGIEGNRKIDKGAAAL